MASGQYLPLAVSRTGGDSSTAAGLRQGHAPRRHRKLLVFIGVLCVVLLAVSPIHPVTRRNYCYLRSKTGSLIGIGSSQACTELLSTSFAPEVVQIWRTNPVPDGYVKHKIHIPNSMAERNVSHVNYAFRSAVVDTVPYEPHEYRQGKMLLRAFIGVYDSPIKADAHMRLSDYFTWLIKTPHFHYGSIKRHNSLVNAGQEEDWIDAPQGFHDDREWSYWLPGSLFNETELGPDTYFTFNHTMTYEGKIVHTYLFDLRRHYVPRSQMAICMKPLYGSDVPAMFTEWREHHRMMGFDVVHWSSRTPALGEAVTKLNTRTKGYDTFAHLPRLAEGSSKEDYWDELLAFDECYTTYRQAHDFIGVWDLDEYLAPAYNHSWTKDFVKSHLDAWKQRNPKSPSIQLPMTWPDRTRYGQLSHEQIRNAATKLPSGEDAEGLYRSHPVLSDQDIQEISELHQSAAKVQYWHTGELSLYVKSIHNTQNVHGANVHHGWPGPGEVQSEANGGKGPDLVIYHARGKQDQPADRYHTPPITPSVVQHWQNLVHRMRQIGSLA